MSSATQNTRRERREDQRGAGFAGVEYRTISALRVAPTNARLHPPSQIADLKKLIAEFGWTMPLLVDETNGIIAGHGRYAAAAELGIEEVPVLVARGWTEHQKRAYILADNRITERGGWNWETVSGELKELSINGMDLGLTGFEPFELEPLLGATWQPPPKRPLPGTTGNGKDEGPTVKVVLTEPQYAIVAEAMKRAAAKTEKQLTEGAALVVIAEAYA